MSTTPLGLAAARHAIDTAFCTLLGLCDEKVGVFLDRAYIGDMRRNVLSHIKDATPNKPCPWCNERGCRLCHATGQVPTQVWMRAPEQLREGATDAGGMQDPVA